MNRRSYLLTLLACLAGAGLALYAGTRVWSLQVVSRPGMSDLRSARTGADIEPWVIGLALVALAGTGALLATRGRLRRGLGGLLTLVGLGVATGAVVGRAGLDAGRAGAGGTVWPVACAVGGAIIALGGLTAARRGHLWPGMSARYERRPVPPPRTDQAAGSEPLATAGLKRGEGSGSTPPRDDSAPDHRATWDALDRGDDPTA
jgi:uncharacterized membrane protein (TIGR02234 family)